MRPGGGHLGHKTCGFCLAVGRVPSRGAWRVIYVMGNRISKPALSKHPAPALSAREHFNPFPDVKEQPACIGATGKSAKCLPIGCRPGLLMHQEDLLSLHHSNLSILF
jgi:hypothetical protein